MELANLTNPFYDLFNDAKFVPIEILTNGIIASICFAGILLNLCLVYVTIKTKSLHSTCNILLALYAFFSSFLLFGYSVKFFIFLFGINFITLKSCFYIQFIPIFGTSFVVTLQLCIGLDRLFGVICPLWYNSQGHWTLFKILIGASLMRAIIDMFLVYYGSSKHWEMRVMCTLSDPTVQPETFLALSIASIILYCGEFVCYALIWLITWWKKAQISENGRRLMLSLSVIMTIGFFCDIGNVAFTRLILPYLNVGPITTELLIRPICIALFVSAYASCVPVLFLLNGLYRNAFRKQLFFFKQVTTVQSLNNKQQNAKQLNVVKYFSTRK